MENGEWSMVDGEFLSRITRILQMARIGEREAWVLVPRRSKGYSPRFNKNIWNECRVVGQFDGFIVG